VPILSPSRVPSNSSTSHDGNCEPTDRDIWFAAGPQVFRASIFEPSHVTFHDLGRSVRMWTMRRPECTFATGRSQHARTARSRRWINPGPSPVQESKLRWLALTCRTKE
jgi:hypothetical protein